MDKLASKFNRHLRPVLLAVDSAASLADDPLIEAINFLKTAFQRKRPLGQLSADMFPKRFIPEAARRYLYAQDDHGQGQLLPDRYEFLVYRLLRNGLEAGDIFCRDSVRFRSFEDDLLDDQKWQEKERLIADTGLTILNQPIQEHLAALEQTNCIADVNQHIASSLNQHIQIKKHGQYVIWKPTYPHDNETVNHPFYDGIRQVEISGVMHFVNQQCRFMDVFEHVLSRYVKQEADYRVIAACLIAATTLYVIHNIFIIMCELRSWRLLREPKGLFSLHPVLLFLE